MTTVTLTSPVTVDGETFTQLTVRPAKVKDQLAATKFSKNDEDREIYLLSTLCGVVPDVLKEMELRDYQKLQTAFMNSLSD